MKTVNILLSTVIQFNRYIYLPTKTSTTFMCQLSASRISLHSLGWYTQTPEGDPVCRCMTRCQDGNRWKPPPMPSVTTFLVTEDKLHPNVRILVATQIFPFLQRKVFLWQKNRKWINHSAHSTPNPCVHIVLISSCVWDMECGQHIL